MINHLSDAAKKVFLSKIKSRFYFGVGNHFEFHIVFRPISTCRFAKIYHIFVFFLRFAGGSHLFCTGSLADSDVEAVFVVAVVVVLSNNQNTGTTFSLD